MRRNDLPKSPHTRKGASVGKLTKLTARVFDPAREQCGEDEMEAAQVAIRGGRVNSHRKRSKLVADPQSEVPIRAGAHSADRLDPGQSARGPWTIGLAVKSSTAAYHGLYA